MRQGSSLVGSDDLLDGFSTAARDAALRSARACCTNSECSFDSSGAFWAEERSPTDGLPYSTCPFDYFRLAWGDGEFSLLYK